jgi:O-antigen ligase
VAGGLLLLLGVLWYFIVGPARQHPVFDAQELTPSATLAPGTLAAMNSPALAYGPGWQVSATGADPAEPPDPWQEPSGTLSFSYTGRELALALAEGDYWGYLYVTVDGEPASRLVNLRGNVDSQGSPAGYKTFLAPELADDGASSVRWQPVHRAPDDGPHQVTVEVWRSWGQTPLRGLAVDALPGPGLPRWPAIALMGAGAWLLLLGLRHRVSGLGLPMALRTHWAAWSGADAVRRAALGCAIAGFGAASVGAGLAIWWLCLLGLAFLGSAALIRPAYWVAALMFGLPFYFAVKLPLLPGRSFELIDIGVAGGLALLIFVMLMAETPPASDYRYRTWPFGLLMALATWALVSAVAAGYPGLALREWRTVFLAGAFFAVLLIGLLRHSDRPRADRRLIVGAWLMGATLMAAIGWWQYGSDSMLITAEGVRRVRGLYGSPNNLALYLERTLAVSLALALFTRGQWRWVWALTVLIQAGALLLTFSKGAIFLALPALLATLWLGGYRLLGLRRESRRILWGLAGIALLAGVALLPFLATERFQRLLDFGSGTGFLRLQLWRSGGQMALDHPLLGVGPDNFLYQFRNRYLLPAAWQEPNLNHPHNWFLDWWTRLGIPGLILGLGFWMSGCRDLLVRLNSVGGEEHDAVLALGFLAAAAAALAHGLIDVSYALPDLMLVWVLIFMALPQAQQKALLRDTQRRAMSATELK